MIKGQDNLKKAYQDDSVARSYVANRFVAPLGALLHARQVKVVRDLIQREALSTAIEIAPGPARLTTDLIPYLGQLTLVDASAEMLQEARRRLNGRAGAQPHFVQADAFNLPIKRRCDLVYSFRLIRHFERPERIKLYRQIGGVLAPRGWLVFDAVNATVSAPLRAKADPGEYAHFDAMLRLDEVRAELDESGFEIVSAVGVQRRYPLLLKCQVLLSPRSTSLARMAMEVIDRLGGEPLEWVVVCRRR